MCALKPNGLTQKKKKTLPCSKVLTGSIWFRQTNVVWVAFVAGTVGLQWMERQRGSVIGYYMYVCVCVCVYVCVCVCVVFVFMCVSMCVCMGF